MTEPSLIPQTITISHNIALTAGFAIAFAGFMLGYGIAWWQRGWWDAKSLAELMRVDDDGVTSLVVGDLEMRIRKSQR